MHRGEANLCIEENKATSDTASAKTVSSRIQTSRKEEEKGQRKGSRAESQETLPVSTLRRWKTSGKHTKCTCNGYPTKHINITSRPEYLRIPTTLSLTTITPPQDIAGRLRHFHTNWEKITQDPWVLSTVLGYTIPFSHVPRQSSRPTSVFSEEERLFIEMEIQHLLQIGAI